MSLFGRKEIKHSEAYTDFKAQLKAVGRQRMEGYDPNLFDKITEQERSEVEKDIWNHFMKKNDADLAVLMPALKNYDGIAALKKKLAELRSQVTGALILHMRSSRRLKKRSIWISLWKITEGLLSIHRSQRGWLGLLKSLECMICWLIFTCMIKTRQTGARL